MNDWHELTGNLRITPFSDGHVVIAVLAEPGIAVPVIGNDFGARNHDSFLEAAKHIGASFRHQDKPDASGMSSTPSRIEHGSGLELPRRGGNCHEGLIMNAAPLAARKSIHPPRFRLPQRALPSTR